VDGVVKYSTGKRGKPYISRPPTHLCMAWNSKRQKYCHAPAGRGTYHLGQGRCKHHDGRRPGHGRRSKYLKGAPTLRERLDRHRLKVMALPLYHDLLRRLNKYVERHPHSSPKDLDRAVLMALSGCIDVVSRVARTAQGTPPATPTG
jgi:hypothetical protein